MGEQAFEYRVQRILEEHGFLVVNCARSKPFDLVAAKNGVVVFVEVKGRNTRYSLRQKKFQKRLALKASVPFAVVRQSKTKGKVQVSFLVSFTPYEEQLLLEAFRKWLE